MLQDIQRWRRIARILARYGYWEFIRRGTGLPAHVGVELPPTDAGLPESKPRRFRMMLEELGPTFIKLGQVLSARPDLVAPNYIEELKRLQDRCEPLPYPVIQEVLLQSLGAEPETLFQSINPHPLATASIAQVHEGTTVGGERVVIKVQRPGVAEIVRFDVDVLYRIARFLGSVFEEAATVDPVGVVEEFDKALTEELNFRHEAANAREFARLHEGRSHIEVPRVLGELSGAMVLTMTFLEGTPLSRLPEDVDRKELALLMVREAFDQVFVDGVFHADPHPGNLLYLGPSKIGILDYGLLGKLNRQMQETLVVFVLAIAVRDADSAARTLYRLGQAEERVDIARLRDDISALFDRYLGRMISSIDSQYLVREILSLALKHHIQIPAQYAMLGRAAATLEGILRELDPELDGAKVAKPYAERLLKDRVAPDNVQSSLYRALLQLDGLSHDLPLQLSQIVADLSSNRFGVRVGGRSFDHLTESLLLASYNVSAAIVGAAFIVGSFIGLAQLDWKIGGIPVVGVAGALVGLSSIFWITFRAMVRPRIRKLSATRLFFWR
ncbi:MAG: AarF/ABC1/UbiB kinase family protein [Myxococcales bacterium]|nr:AarF/ABC1/UbiB kinase family protein [Myxococcales bacterium]